MVKLGGVNPPLTPPRRGSQDSGVISCPVEQLDFGVQKAAMYPPYPPSKQKRSKIWLPPFHGGREGDKKRGIGRRFSSIVN